MPQVSKLHVLHGNHGTMSECACSMYRHTDIKDSYRILVGGGKDIACRIIPRRGSLSLKFRYSEVTSGGEGGDSRAPPPPLPLYATL